MAAVVPACPAQKKKEKEIKVYTSSRELIRQEVND